MPGNRIAEIRADQRAFHNLPEPIGNIHVAFLQLRDRPAIGIGDAALGLPLGQNRPHHIRPRRHVLRSQRPSGKRPLDMQRLPAALELVFVTVVPEKSPDIFN
jgi:hypothetical protein